MRLLYLHRPTCKFSSICSSNNVAGYFSQSLYAPVLEPKLHSSLSADVSAIDNFRTKARTKSSRPRRTEQWWTQSNVI